MGRKGNGITRRAFMGGAAAFGALAVMSPTHAFAESSDETKAKADEARSQLTDMQSKLEQASDDYNRALQDRDAAKQAMADAQTRIDDLNGQIGEVQSKLSTRARSMYRSGTASYLTCLLGASTFTEFTTNLDMLNALNQNDANMVQQSKDLRQQAQDERDEYQHQSEVADQRTQDAADIKKQTEDDIAQMQQTIDSLDDQTRQELEAEQAAQAAAAAQAASQQMVQQSMQQSDGGGSSDGGGTAAASSDDGGYSGGSYDGGYSGGDDSGPTYSGGGSSAPSNGSVVDYALSRIGCPYVWGAEGPDAFDCSGLTKWCYGQVGIYLPHQTESQYAAASAVMPISECAAGDVLWRYGHVGIAQIDGGSQYIHAPTFGAYVRNTDPLSWAGFTAALRF